MIRKVDRDRAIPRIVMDLERLGLSKAADSGPLADMAERQLSATAGHSSDLFDHLVGGGVLWNYSLDGESTHIGQFSSIVRLPEGVR